MLVKVGLPISHEVYAGENVCWAYLTAKCSDVAAASQHLAEHGRTAHKLHDQWKVECKRATSQGIKPPNPPTAKKKETSAKRAGGGGHAKSDSDSDAELAGKHGTGLATLRTSRRPNCARKRRVAMRPAWLGLNPKPPPTPRPPRSDAPTKTVEPPAAAPAKPSFLAV